MKLQPQAFLRFLFHHLKGCHLHIFFKALKSLVCFMRNVLGTLDIYVIILMKWVYLLFSEEMHGIFGLMFFKREETNFLLRF